MYNFHVEQNNQIARICSVSGKIRFIYVFDNLIFNTIVRIIRVSASVFFLHRRICW